MSLIVFWPRLGRLGQPWGSGDFTQSYLVAGMWNGWTFGSTTDVGFPYGLNAEVYSGIDGFQNSLARIINAISGNPYLGLNLLLFLSFPIVALFALWAIRLMGLRGPVAVVLAVGFTFIPYHLARGLNHVHLALLWGLMAGVLLSLLIGSGRLGQWLSSGERRVRLGGWAVTAGLVVTAAWSGLYYAVFSVILCAAAWLWRAAHRASIRDLVREGLAAISLVVLAGLAMLPVALSRQETAGAADVGLRSPMDSVDFAGNLVAATLPQPISVFLTGYNELVNGWFAEAPPTEGNLTGNFGSWITTACILAWAIGMVVVTRRAPYAALGLDDVAEKKAVDEAVSARPSLSFLAYLLLVTLLFYVPWGLNFLSANLLTAQVRAWNRLTPLVLLLAVLGAAGVLVSIKWPRWAQYVVSVLVLVVVAAEMLLPWRGIYAFTVDLGESKTNEVDAYSTALLDVGAPQCPMFTYPVMQYPENGPPSQRMDDYDHFYLTMSDLGRQISYGANKMTAGSDWQVPLAGGLTSESLADLKAHGFCLIHLDTFGYDDPSEIKLNLATLLGPPVVTSPTGRYEAYLVP